MRKRRNKILLVLAVIVLIFAILIVTKLPKDMKTSIKADEIQKLADGDYQGCCENGLVLVKVKTKLKNGRIQEIKLLEHRNGLGNKAEAITEEVITQQSLAVDSISGATYSSKTILKAIENSLLAKE